MPEPPKQVLKCEFDPVTGRMDFEWPENEVFAAGMLSLLTEKVRAVKILPAVLPRIHIAPPSKQV